MIAEEPLVFSLASIKRSITQSSSSRPPTSPPGPPAAALAAPRAGRCGVSRRDRPRNCRHRKGCFGLTHSVSSTPITSPALSPPCAMFSIAASRERDSHGTAGKPASARELPLGRRRRPRNRLRQTLHAGVCSHFTPEEGACYALRAMSALPTFTAGAEKSAAISPFAFR